MELCLTLPSSSIFCVGPSKINLKYVQVDRNGDCQ